MARLLLASCSPKWTRRLGGGTHEELCRSGAGDVGGRVALAIGLGCNGGRDGAPLVAHERIVHAPLAPRITVVPLVAAPGAHAAPLTQAAPIPSASVEARILVITANGTDAAFAAIQNTLQYLGTPFDVLNATTGATLTADMLGSGAHGKYQAVFLDLGDLSVNGTSAFTDAEWTTLATYEASFGVRRVSLYTSPTADYGLSDSGSVDPSVTPISATCTAAGRSVFVGANCANPVTINAGFAYPASPRDGATIPLLVDAAGTSTRRPAPTLTAARRWPSPSRRPRTSFRTSSSPTVWSTGRRTASSSGSGTPTRSRSSTISSSASDIYTGGVYRITSADLQAFASWENATRAQPLTADFRFAWACNGQGSQSMPGDPLTATAVALGSTFSWINHTWDHPVLDGLSYAQVLDEFTRNDQYLRGFGLAPYASVNAVTPNISGLASADAMLAIHDVGITQIVSDTSQPGQNNPHRTRGSRTRFQPAVLEIPRIASELYYNVSQPSEWIPEYEALRSPTAAVDYGTIIGTEERRLPAIPAERQQRSLDVSSGERARLRRRRAQPAHRSDGRHPPEIRRGGDLPRRQPQHGRACQPGEEPDGLERVRRRGDGSGGHLADGLRQQRGDGPRHRALHAGRRDVRRPDDLVPDPRGRAVGDAVARRLQPGQRGDGGRRRRAGTGAGNGRHRG